MSRIPLSLADCQKVNAVIPPTAGVPVGGGIHVVLPANWRAKIATGEAVPGCTYLLPDSDGAVTISADTNAQLVASHDPKAAQVLAAIAAAVPLPDPVGP